MEKSLTFDYNKVYAQNYPNLIKIRTRYTRILHCARALKGELEAPVIDYSKPFSVYFGGFKFTHSLNELDQGIDLSKGVYLGGEFPIKITIEDKKILITVDIKNENNDTIVKIVENNWMVNDARAG